MNQFYHIAVTGMGIITPAGTGLEPFAGQLFAGSHQFAEITGFDTTNHRTSVGAEIQACGYQTKNLDQSLLARTDLFGLEAASQALTDAGLLAADGSCLDPGMGIVCGTAGGAISGLETFFYKRFQGEECQPEKLLTSFCLSALATNLAGEFGIAGPRTTMATVCSSSGLALARGFEMLLADIAMQHVLVVSAESLSEVTHGGFNALRSIAPELCQPFDKNRKGLILGEAGCAVVLSRTQPAGYGYLAGYGLTTDLYHFTAPDPRGGAIATAISKGLGHAGLKPDDVDYINCHGTATLKNDAAEAMGIRAVFKDQKIPVSSTKSMFGHTLGSASLLEAIATLLGMEKGVCPSSANITCLDDVQLNVITTSEPCKITAAVSNSFAFGGSDISLVFTKNKSFGHPLKTCKEKAVITGVGIVSPLGVGCENFKEAVLAGQNGLQSMSCFGDEFTMQGGLVDMAEVRSHIPLKRRRRLNRLGSFLTVAVDEALDAAGLAEQSSEMGMVYGSAFGCSSNVHRFYSQLLEGGATAASPQEFMFSVTNAPAALVAQYLQLQGEVWVLVQDEVSWEAALHYGTFLIESGREKRVLVTAADELSDSILAIHQGLGFLESGYIPGEGCVAMVLEAESEAMTRQAPVLGTVQSCEMIQDVQCGPMDFSAYQYDTLTESFQVRVGQSGVVGGLGLAAGLLTGTGEKVDVSTSSRGGIVASTVVLR